jgi:hypothetical protein
MVRSENLLQRGETQSSGGIIGQDEPQHHGRQQGQAQPYPLGNFADNIDFLCFVHK